MPPLISGAIERAPSRGLKSVFLEIPRNERCESGESLLRIFALRTDPEHRTMSRSKHHEAHNALAVNFFPIFLNANIASEFARRFDKLGGGPGVDAKLVANGEFAALGGRLNQGGGSIRGGWAWREGN
jgi:hypothetical protein